MNIVRPYRIGGQGTCVELACFFERISDQWKSRWLQPDQCGNLGWTIEDLAYGPDQSWRASASDAETWIAWRQPERSNEIYLAGLFGVSASAPLNSLLLDSVVDDCLNDLASTVLDSVRQEGCEDRRPKAAIDFETGPGSGAVIATLRSDSEIMAQLMIGGGVVSAILANGERCDASSSIDLVQRRDAIGNQLLRAEFLAGSAEIAVQDLLGLAVGDVLILSKSEAEAPSGRVAGGGKIGRVDLGVIGSQRAVRFVTE